MNLRRRRTAGDARNEHCYRHVLDAGVNRCGQCRQAICRFCVIPLPRLSTTLCVTCALAASGIRSRSRLA